MPLLSGLGRVGIDNDVFVRGLGDLALDLAACWMVGKGATIRRGAGKHLEAAFLGDRLQRVGRAVHSHSQAGGVLVPAQLLNEQGTEVEVLQALPDMRNVDEHRGLAPQTVPTSRA